ncbi:hypothetical protein [Salinicola sp. DM10]|uniref:phage fiber-tail adaptor protein n=1 Tax=Salinicola sp. DM10 TaxID=2815721 RepID=UPI001A90C245|nr:hypothetical protein [Salinicola sp. DM10]MCE3025727.1 hypothetical protein [Salinicola sp. DM10]
MKSFRKQPRDHLDYDVILTDWLEPEDEITGVEIETPAGIAVTQRSVEPDRIKVWVAGGASGQSYKLTLLIYTRSRIKEVELLIIVVEM